MALLGCFFTNFWNIVSVDVIQAAVHFFPSSRLLRATNAYFLPYPKKIVPIHLLRFSAYHPS